MKKINVEKAEIKEWISVLSLASRKEHYPRLWKRLHRLVAVPTRRRVAVNLSKIEQYTKEGDNVVVPGKILGMGQLTHKVNIAALEFSGPAIKGLKQANCSVIDIKDLVNSKKVKVII